MRFFKRSEDTSDSRGFIQSVDAALEGIVHTLQTERNMRIHFITGFLVLIAGIYFNFGPVEFILLCFAVAFVLIAEMFNTAVEHGVDLISEEYHPMAKVIKDIAAGAVFVSAVNAAIVGYILFSRRIGTSVGDLFKMIKQSPWHITVIALLVVAGVVLVIKVARREKRLLHGGMPSGHAAIAFAVWMIVTFIAGRALISILVFFLALLIAKSRISKEVHNFWEVFAGGVLGALLALLVMQLLSQ